MAKVSPEWSGKRALIPLFDSHDVRSGLFFGSLFGNLLLRLIRFLNGTNILAPQLLVKFVDFFHKLR
jgi:hypothetical protein